MRTTFTMAIALQVLLHPLLARVREGLYYLLPCCDAPPCCVSNL